MGDPASFERKTSGTLGETVPLIKRGVAPPPPDAAVLVGVRNPDGGVGSPDPSLLAA